MLEARQILPEFSVTTVDGGRFAYGDIWHRRNLVLIALGPGTQAEAARRAAQFQADNA